MENESYLEKAGREPNADLKKIIPSLSKVEKMQIINVLENLKSGKLFE
jgi:hypothetical protein